MHVVKVALAGTMTSQAETNSFLAVENILKNIPNVELTSDRAKVEAMMDLEIPNFTDLLLEMALKATEDAEVLAVHTSSLKYSSIQWLGFVMGYAWSQGVPVVLITNGIDLEDFKVNFMISRTLHAHLHSDEEIMQYDWENYPTTAIRAEMA